MAVFEPPSVTVKYDCQLNIANFEVEWPGSIECVIGFMYIDFNAANVEYKWELNNAVINETRRVEVEYRRIKKV